MDNFSPWGTDFLYHVSCFSILPSILCPLLSDSHFLTHTDLGFLLRLCIPPPWKIKAKQNKCIVNTRKANSNSKKYNKILNSKTCSKREKSFKLTRHQKLLNHVNKWKVLKITVIFQILYRHFPTKMVGLQSDMKTFLPVRGGAGPGGVPHDVLWAAIKAVMLLRSFFQDYRYIIVCHAAGT